MGNRLGIMQLLHRHLPDMVCEFGIHDLALFGSVARDEAGEISDIDILVTFDGSATAERYFGLQFYLEDLLGRPVDLVTDKALRPELRPYIEREAMPLRESPLRGLGGSSAIPRSSLRH